jgi:hypothetical protein
MLFSSLLALEYLLRSVRRLPVAASAAIKFWKYKKDFQDRNKFCTVSGLLKLET